MQYQFGDADGLWAAVLHRTAEHRADVFEQTSTSAPLRQRVADIIDTLYDGLTATDSKAIENLRAALPRDPAELERLYPRTAAELQSWDEGGWRPVRTPSPAWLSTPHECGKWRRSYRVRCVGSPPSARSVATSTWTWRGAG